MRWLEDIAYSAFLKMDALMWGVTWSAVAGTVVMLTWALWPHNS